MSKTAQVHLRSRFISILLIVAITAALFCVPVYAESNQNVTDAANGVLRVVAVYKDEFNAEENVHLGSAFLINENTIVTAEHVLDTSSVLEYLAAEHGKTVEEIFNRLSYGVIVSRDVTIKASVMNKSVEMDFAIMKLETSLQNTSPLVMRHSSEVEPTEKVYAIGFPELSSIVQDINTYRPEDVTISDGRVNKVTTGMNAWSLANTDYIQTSCQLNTGISGGPMVDEDGKVIGICQSRIWQENQESDGYFYAIAIDQVLTVCDSLGIVYDIDNAPVVMPDTPTDITDVGVTTPPGPEPNVSVDTSQLNNELDAARALNKDDYTSESYAVLDAAISEGISALTSNDQTTVDKAATNLRNARDKLVRNEVVPEGIKGLPTLVYVLIGAIALVIIAAIIIIIALNRGKKKKAEEQRRQQQLQQQQQQRQQQAGHGYSQNIRSGQGGVSPTGGSYNRASVPPVQRTPDTTVLLDKNVGTTELLVKGGTLIRTKTGESLEIDRDEYVIGRESSRVAYCIEGNSAIGRTHAKISVRNGVAYLVDLNSKNGTFVNSVKCIPNKEKALADGDKILLADEEFTYRA